MSVYESSKLVTALQVAEMENVKFRGGRAFCPFHDDGKNPSLSFKGRFFRCFGCGEHGDSIDFTAKLFHMTKHDAAVWLNGAFSLGLTDEKPDITARQKRERDIETKRQREKSVAAAKGHLYWAARTIANFIPSSYDEITGDMAKLLELSDKIDYILDEAEFPDEIGWKVAETVAAIRSRVCGRR